MLNVELVREQFPAFSEPGLQEWSNFENAGGSYMCGQVSDRLRRFFLERKIQPYGPAAPSRLGGEEMDEARLRMAHLLGVDAREISMGPSTSQNSYVLASAFGAELSEDDAIIVTNQDHEANSGPWRRLGRSGVEIREWRINRETGLLEIPELERLLDRHVRLVCIPHCSNIVGAINPVRQIVELARSTGAVTCVDGVSFAPHGLPYIPDLDVDIYLFSAYKTYGPHQGLMYIRRELAERLENQGHFFLASDPTKRFTPAGPDHAQIAACAGIADYMDWLATEHRMNDPDQADHTRSLQRLMRGHEISLSRTLLDYLSTRSSIRICGPTDPESRVPTISIVHRKPGSELASNLADHGIIAGGGHFYGIRCLEGLGIDPEHGVLRLSFVHYTDRSEIDRLIDALDWVI